MKIIVSITDGKRTYSEDVTDDQRYKFESFPNELRNQKIIFKTYTRELKPFPFTTAEISKFNTRDENSHFIFGWVESLAQSEDIPGWMVDVDVDLTISVKHELDDQELATNQTLKIYDDILETVQIFIDTYPNRDPFSIMFKSALQRIKKACHKN